MTTYLKFTDRETAESALTDAGLLMTHTDVSGGFASAVGPGQQDQPVRPFEPFDGPSGRGLRKQAKNSRSTARHLGAVGPFGQTGVHHCLDAWMTPRHRGHEVIGQHGRYLNR